MEEKQKIATSKELYTYDVEAGQYGQQYQAPLGNFKVGEMIVYERYDNDSVLKGKVISIDHKSKWVSLIGIDHDVDAKQEKVRELRNPDGTQGGQAKEFNHVKIVNLEAFLENYPHQDDTYMSPYAILADLESQVKYLNNPLGTVYCSYKQDDDVVFSLMDLYEEGQRRVLVYYYSGFDSTHRI